MRKYIDKIERYFLSEYLDLPQSVRAKSRYLLFTALVGSTLLSVSTLTYLISGHWSILTSNLSAFVFVVASLICLKKKQYVASSNFLFLTVFAALVFQIASVESVTGLDTVRISELGDSIIHFTIGLIFIGFLSFKYYQPMVFTLIGMITVAIHYHIILNTYHLDYTSEIYILRLIDAELFMILAGFGSFFGLKVSNVMISHLQTESQKVKSANKKLESTVKLRTIELEVANVELKEKTQELEKFNSELHEAKSKAEEASIAKEQFLSTMSHEIRTPLNAVIGMTHLLREENPRKDQKENLEVLQVSAKHLLGLINDILDFTKIESGKIDLEKIEIDTGETFSDLKKMFTYQAREKGLDLNLKIAPDVPQTIRGDSGRLIQIVSNLMSNAIKFTESGKVELYVDSQKTENGIELEIQVIDTGIGIPKNKQENIFEHFTQASSDTTRKYGGTGLGLAIIKRLVEIQQGTIKLDNNTPNGSIFTVVIPYELPSTSKGTKSEQAIDKAQLKNAHVLIVEDNPFNQEVVTKILDNWGITSDTAENGEETLKIIQDKEFAVVLMDINLPDMSGFEITEKIRNHESDRISSLPIIAQTADISTQSIEKAKEVGMNDVIAKPIIPAILFEKLEALLNHQEA